MKKNKVISYKATRKVAVTRAVFSRSCNGGGSKHYWSSIISTMLQSKLKSLHHFQLLIIIRSETLGLTTRSLKFYKENVRLLHRPSWENTLVCDCVCVCEWVSERWVSWPVVDACIPARTGREEIPRSRLQARAGGGWGRGGTVRCNKSRHMLGPVHTSPQSQRGNTLPWCSGHSGDKQCIQDEVDI